MTNLICLVTRHLYGISAFVPQTSFCRETVIDIAKIMSAPFSGKPSIKFPLFFYAPGNANDCSARGVRGVFPIMTYVGKLLIKEVTFSVKIVHKRVRDWITPFLPHPVQCFDELGFFLFEAQDLIPLDVRFEGGYKVNNHGDLQDCTCVRMV